MRPTRFPLAVFLAVFSTILCVHSNARADDTEGDEYDVNARVVRISLMHGDVSLKRHDSEDWEIARLNTPLVEGDTLATGTDARAEIQIDARNFVRISSDSVLRIITLRPEGIALSLAQGTATLRLARFDRDHEYFEIDAPKTTIAAESKGVYRVDAERKGGIHLTVLEGGRARVYSDTAGFTVRDGHSATLTYEGEESGDWQTAEAPARDNWDDWVNDRERYLATRFKYDQNMRYYESDIWGAEDLDAYGSWSYTNDYGWIWRPQVTVINNYNDWAPYRYGQWTWCPPYGWTWVGEEPWGWAPYHYGRWVYYNGYWAWCPHSYYRPHRNWWRPALVAFVSIDFNFGSNYCWYPLSYRQRDPRSVYFQRDRERLRPLRSDELADLRRINPAYFRAVTAVPAREFGRQSGRPQPANGDLARRVIGAQPLRGDLPVRPAVVAGSNAGVNRVARPAPAVSSRPTGATARMPGVPLDNELRRSRIFNGRDPVTTPSVNNGVRTSDPTSTGAVARPARSADPQFNRGLDLKRNPDGNVTSNDRPVRNRPPENQPNPGVERGRDDHNPAAPQTEQPTTPRPVRPREDRPNPGVERGRDDHNPAAPQTERPAGGVTPAQPARPDRNERPPQRDESPAPRHSSPPPSETPRAEAPRSSPPPAAPPSPPRSESPRSESPRSESPRSESPRSAPPPEKSEPAKPAKPSEEQHSRLERKGGA